MKKQSVIYYSDLLNDDFANTNIKTKAPSKRFQYLPKNPIWRIFSFLLYRLIATPLAFLYSKIFYHTKIVNRKAMRKAKRQGCFCYANHTGMAYDALHPTRIVFPKRAYLLSHPDSLSIPGLGTVVHMLGSLPLYSDYAHTKQCLEAISALIKKKECVYIYPEAHIWPYCTFIRPFDDRSFRYPVKENAPVYACTTTFSRKRFSLFRHLPKISIYVDGPFYPDQNLPVRERQKKLRDAVYQAMVERSKNNSVELVKYIEKKAA